MSPQPIPLPITAEEFLAAGDEGRKADLIDGSIYPAPFDEPSEDRRAFLVRTLVQRFADLNRLGETYGSCVPFVFSRYCCLEPDISFVTTERLGMMDEVCGRGAPDLVIEFVTSQTSNLDYARKRVLYEEAGVREYWIIDPLERRCLFLRLMDGQFTEVPLDDEQIFHSEVLSGFRLDVKRLFTEPLPLPTAYLVCDQD